MQECGTPLEGVESRPAAETSKCVLWRGYGRKHADYSFGRSHGNVEITDSFGRSGGVMLLMDGIVCGTVPGAFGRSEKEKEVTENRRSVCVLHRFGPHSLSV